MDTPHTHRIESAIASLRNSVYVVLTGLDDLSDLIDKLPAAASAPPVVEAASAGRRVRTERATYTVQWLGRSCDLGPTRAFEVMVMLCRYPDEYVPIDRLIDELWSGSRSYSTVRSTVSRLKSKLCEGEMADLAARIDGSTRGHYRLRLNRP